MDICEALYSYLSSDTSIKNMVGNRIYPLILPQNCVLPSICYTPVLANYDSALQGDTGYVRQTIQVTSHAKTYKEARELSRLVKNALQDKKGTMGGLTIEATFIKSDYIINSNSTSKFDIEEYMSSIEFEFQFNEGGN